MLKRVSRITTLITRILYRQTGLLFSLSFLSNVASGCRAKNIFWEKCIFPIYMDEMQDARSLRISTRTYMYGFFSILLTHEGSHSEVYRDFQPSLTSSAGGAKGCSDHRFRVPPAYTAQLLTLHQPRANNQYRTANQI